jgi:hypothetical protein
MAEDIDTEIPERCPWLTPRTHCKKIETVPEKRLTVRFKLLPVFQTSTLQLLI